jgi:hypothetical protein
LFAGFSRCSARTQNENQNPNPNSNRIAVFIGNNNQLSAPKGDNPELQPLPVVRGDNKVSDTPQTDDLARGNHVVPTEWAEQLERERDEARIQYRSTLALAEALANTQIKSKKEDK